MNVYDRRIALTFAAFRKRRIIDCDGNAAVKRKEPKVLNRAKVK
jgi:hypothetical protein